MFQNLLNYLSENKNHALLIGGYFLILISIPLSFTLVKSSQILGSRAAEIKPTPIQTTSSLEVPKTSPLDELKNSSAVTPTPSTDSQLPTADSNVNFGPTLNFNIALEGRPQTNQAAQGGFATKVFIGIASGNITTKPTYLLTFTVNVPSSGQYKGLSLAGLTSGGTYTAYIKGPGQIDKGITFVMSPSETNLNNLTPITLTSGDLNEDNTINTTDDDLIKKLYGSNSNSSNWNPNADFNSDGIINNLDLSILRTNLDKTGDSGIWYSPPPSTSSTGGAGQTISSGGLLDSLRPQGSPTASTSGSSPRTSGYWLWVP